jgi:hypothetical protein
LFQEFLKTALIAPLSTPQGPYYPLLKAGHEWTLHAHMHSLTHSFTHSHSLTHSLTFTLSLSLTHSHALTHSFAHSLTLTHSLALSSLTHSFTPLLTHSLTLLLTFSLTRSLTVSLSLSLSHSLRYLATSLFLALNYALALDRFLHRGTHDHWCVKGRELRFSLRKVILSDCQGGNHVSQSEKSHIVRLSESWLCHVYLCLTFNPRLFLRCGV